MLDTGVTVHDDDELPSDGRQILGTRLVEAFERHARERGCTAFYLETFSFQAPTLYGRLGYRAELSIDGFAPGVVKHFMTKEVSAGTRDA